MDDTKQAVTELAYNVQLTRKELMEIAQTIKSAAFLPNLHNLDQLFETPQKKTVVQLRWPLVILSS